MNLFCLIRLNCDRALTIVFIGTEKLIQIFFKKIENKRSGTFYRRVEFGTLLFFGRYNGVFQPENLQAKQ